MSKLYVFDNVDVLASYLYSLKKDISPIKLQKSLYFLYAFYAGMYYQNQDQVEFKGGVIFPNELFEADFEAWTYGPAIREVYDKRKDGSQYYLDFMNSQEYLTFMQNLRDEDYGSIVLEFINDVFQDISVRSDFALVERSHEDQTWLNAYEDGKKKMKNSDIIDEYVKAVRFPRRSRQHLN
ncbi:hypothetical protein CKF54_07350 [Psittacicella hinzii]|uniref:Antitoxin SocA-like Panacea domain-containing protein n=1 Tax=Psittacicella hinzii TaxID=2028575 RepID=A0A3A1XYV1_9GAMM|nr:type II toxin-antitoxin system antitoxin SocA domain-containing protein [Psittacicella hinzii]RIY31153.1 hypothetical protein CKF54_07350 [Psittacicella hinzii]